MSPAPRPRQIRLCNLDRFVIGAAGVLLTTVGSCTLAVASWTLLKVVDLGERVSALEGRLTGYAEVPHSTTTQLTGR